MHTHTHTLLSPSGGCFFFLSLPAIFGTRNGRRHKTFTYRKKKLKGNRQIRSLHCLYDEL